MAYDPNQPRDPAGSETGGEWTVAGNAARKAAGLDKQYMVKGVVSGKSLPVYVVPGGGVLSKEAFENTDEPEAIAVIYNAETNNWHVASTGEFVHGNFSRYAKEGVEKTFEEQFLVRGYLYNRRGGSVRMYDYEDMIPDIIGDKYQYESMLIAGLSRVRGRVESNPLSFYDKAGTLVTPRVRWDKIILPPRIRQKGE